jgi:accessory gene regulator protein AgrB
MRLIISVVIMIAMGLIAYKKGFKPWLWILAGGIPGIIVLAFMPSAKAEGIDDATREKRRKNGNITGAVISAIAIVIMVALIAWVATQ